MSLTGRELAKNLVFLSSQLKTLSPYSAEVRRGFKEVSKNDTIRTIIYLLDLVGRAEQDRKALTEENSDLKELLKTNGIGLDEKTGSDDSKGSNEEGSAIAETTVQGDQANGAA